jgi:hypothetical protein
MCDAYICLYVYHSWLWQVCFNSIWTHVLDRPAVHVWWLDNHASVHDIRLFVVLNEYLFTTVNICVVTCPGQATPSSSVLYSVLALVALFLFHACHQLFDFSIFSGLRSRCISVFKVVFLEWRMNWWSDWCLIFVAAKRCTPPVHLIPRMIRTLMHAVRVLCLLK